MEWYGIVGVIAFLSFIFLATQTLALYLYLKENERLREENEKLQPPF